MFYFNFHRPNSPEPNDDSQPQGVSQPKQLKLTSYVSSSAFYPNNHKRKLEIDEALTAFIAGDLRSFKTVDTQLFKNFIRLLDPKYEVPDRKTLSGVHMRALYTKVRDKLTELIASAEFVSLTTDTWTSISNQTFIAFTCHFIQEDKLSSYVLEAKQLETDGCTAQELAFSIENILHDWNIPKEKIAYVVTDNAKNEENACLILKLKHLGCFAHTVNLVLKDTLSFESLKPLIKKCKELVAYFKSSPKATRLLVKEQQREGDTKEPLKLKQEVPTRWNSMYYMIERIVVLSDPLLMALIKLDKTDMCLSTHELEVLRELEKILQMFNDVTEIVSGGSYTTVSLVIPLVYILKEEVKRLKDEIKTEEGKQVLMKLEKSMENRLDVYEGRTCTMMATLLDHRWKTSFFQSESNAQKARNYLQNAVSYIVKSKSQQSEASTSRASDAASEEELTNKPKAGRSLMEALEKKKKTLHANRTSTVDAILLVKNYFQINPVANTKENDPVRYWAQESTKQQFHPMETLARKYLCVPATSVPSERVFSTAGFTISQSRNRLSSEKANMQVFLHDNYDLLLKILKN